MIKAKIKQPTPSTPIASSDVPENEKLSPHEINPVVAKDPVFYDIMKANTKLTVETLNNLYDAWKIGCDTVEAAALAGIYYHTLYNWLNEYPELKDVRDRVRTHPRTLAKRNVLRRLEKDEAGEFSLKYLEKVKPEEFGGKGAVININNNNVSLGDKMNSLSEFMGTFGVDIIEQPAEVTDND